MAAQEYITIHEAAELEGIKYITMYKRVSRNASKYDIKSEGRVGGGYDLRLISTTCLSSQAQAMYRERQRVLALAADAEMSGADGEVPSERPWYVNADIEWYIHQYNENYYKGMELGNVVRRFMEQREREEDRTEYAESFAQEHLGKGARTLYRYVDQYMEALAWQNRMEQTDGCSYEYFRVLCLCRKPKDVGRFPSFTPEVKQTIKNIWFDKEFASNRGTKEMLYDKLKEIQRLKGWERIPSYQSVTRYIKYLMEEEGMKNAHFLAANGQREYKNKVMTKRRRDTTALEVMEILQGDEHTFDCWVTYRSKNGEIIPIRPKLVCWIDTRSRWIMGDVMCRDANAQILKQSLFKLIYHDAHGVPKYLYIDNGKDFTKGEMLGVARKDRHNQQAKEEHFAMAFDDVTRGFYRSIGIEDEKISMPYEPWTKGQIERFFDTVCEKFTKWFTSYTGTLTGSKTADKVDKDIIDMARKGKLLTIEEFYKLWIRWKNEVYANWKHSELRKAGEEYRTPLSLFENGPRYEKAAPPKAMATMLMMKSDSVRVYNTGIRRFGYYYNDEELYAHIGEMVNIKYDPDDVSEIYVFSPKSGKLICRAASQELLGFGDHMSEDVLVQHRRNQNAQIRRDRKILEDAAKTPEEIAAEREGYKEVIGGIDLMIGGKGKPKKTVAFPSDETYRQNRKELAKPRAAARSEYMDVQAQKAIEKLQALGEE